MEEMIALNMITRNIRDILKKDKSKDKEKSKGKITYYMEILKMDY